MAERSPSDLEHHIMNIGIVSLYGWLKVWDNYGTLLQNYALQVVLKRMGHSPYWIRTRVAAPGFREPVAVARRVGEVMKVVTRRILSPLLGPSVSARLAEFNRRHPREFGAFLERHVPRSPREYSLPELRTHPPEADAYIVGSDQVWRDVTSLNFLDFGDREIRRIAYAVSAPWPALDQEWLGNARAHVGRFQAISVREREGVDVCRAIGVPDAMHVIDPTLLLDAADYLRIVQEEKTDAESLGRFALAYFVNIDRLEQVPWDASLALTAQRELALKVVPLQGAELVVPSMYCHVPTPTGWISAFHRAECVVTNSYHGALFAVIMQRPFLVCLQGGATAPENCRFTSILEPLGLADRMLASADWTALSGEMLDARMFAPIDWTSVAARLRVLRERSTAFLVDALARTTHS